MGALNGKKLPSMTAEEIAEATAKPTETATDRFMSGMALECNKCIKDAKGEDVDMQQHLYQIEIDYLKKFKAFNYSEVLLSNEQKAIAEMYFHICGLIIHAVNSGNHTPTPGLCLYTASRSVEYPESKLFLSFQKGDTFLALDAPFIAHMDPGADLKLDDERGIKIVYVLKFAIEDQTGMNFVGAGAVFHQLLDASAHSTMLHILSGLMSPKMANFGAYVAHSQVPACPSSSPSSSSYFAQIRDNDVAGP